MKYIFLLPIFLMITYNIFGQCSVEMTTDDSGITYYMANKEQIYQSDFLDDGVIIAFGQLTVMQKPENNKLLIFVLTITIGADEELMIIPRKLTISFKDYSSIILNAQTLNKPKYTDQTRIESCGFKLSLADYGQLHKKAIASIKIEDTRTNKSITTNPYEYLFVEQANCLAKNLKR